MTLPIAQSMLVAWLLCGVRVLGWMLVAPPLSTSSVPIRVRVSLSAAIGLLVAPAAAAHLPGTSLGEFAAALLWQVVVGAALGFGTRLIYAAVESAGSLIDLFGGFSLSTAFDPLLLNQGTIVGRFFQLLATTLLFVTQGHVVLLGGFVRSFQAVPLDTGLGLGPLSAELTSRFTGMFLAALQISGPLVVVLFLADAAMGVVNRVAPQMNVFQLSFPLKIMLTLLLVGFVMLTLPEALARLVDQSVTFLFTVLGLG